MSSESRKPMVLPRPSVKCMTLVAIMMSGFGANALASDHYVTGQTSTFDCSAVSPGDTVTLAAGTRGPLVIKNCRGTATQRIRIRNDAGGTGPVVIRRTSGNAGGFIFSCVDCIQVNIDGSAKWVGAPASETRGIKITMAGGGAPSAFMKVAGLSRFMTIRYIEIDGTWPSIANDGIGMSVNDHNMNTVDNPGIWREGFLIEHNYVHNTEGEGLYVGSNYNDGHELPVRDVEIRNNLIEDTGWDGMNLKYAIAGNNKIHHNVLKRVGSELDATSGQHRGMTMYEGGGSIYNNWIEKSGQAGILHFLQYLPESFGTQTCEIYNNVIVSPGQTDPSIGHGILSSNRSGAAVPLPKIYNNTVIGANGDGIRVGDRAAGGFVRDNIVAGAAGVPIGAPGNVVQENNRAGSISNMGFANAAANDYRLTPGSPARNAGGAGFPPTDYLDVPRPQEGAADQGAFEYDADANNDAPPNAPVITTVQ